MVLVGWDQASHGPAANGLRLFGLEMIEFIVGISICAFQLLVLYHLKLSLKAALDAPRAVVVVNGRTLTGAPRHGHNTASRAFALENQMSGVAAFSAVPFLAAIEVGTTQFAEHGLGDAHLLFTAVRIEKTLFQFSAKVL
jgi:hypothetical protein